MRTYALIVIGGGHAGVEAASAAARILSRGEDGVSREDCASSENGGARVAQITPDPAALGRMSCNPAIGGTAKGHLVREIDALGGSMGLLSDRAALQMRTLNLSKGAAVHATRAQSDRARYEQGVFAYLAAHGNLDIIRGRAEAVLAEKECGSAPGAAPSKTHRVRGVRLASGEELAAQAVVVAAGTFLNGVLYFGLETRPGGRIGEEASAALSDSLRGLGLESGRLMTCTPPRLYRASVDLSVCEAQDGDPDTRPFSRRTPRTEFPYLTQLPCYITWTNQQTHEIIRCGLDRAPQYTGDISGAGPKYCPAIEDKIVRFAERERHQLFLEPEGEESDLLYVNGFPTTLPGDVQEAALRTVPGLENARVAIHGYGIEYDFFPARQLRHSLETKPVRGLYLAGQINGTSGYEEAAAQGLMAGINAALSCLGREPLVLGRHEAYIGVLIDDLISKVPLEPYRMFTSRAEFRLLLREDNADRRLMRHGHALGLVGGEQWREQLDFEKRLAEALDAFHRAYLSPEKINPHLRGAGLQETDSPLKLAHLAMRADGRVLKDALPYADTTRWPALMPDQCDSRVLDAAIIELRYEGYTKREREEVARFLKMEEKRIPEDIDYSAMQALSAEGREVLGKIRPQTLGQASRLAGVRSADISVLMVLLRTSGAGAHRGGA